ncbi:MAG: cobalt ECF transporter T component CbiQ [Chlamydiae bacterium]|nr:MAG: cobalt ECF transporter T component CbiQ [Chlamydiota bacterium]
MKHDFLDKYSKLGSVIHKLDPRAKIITFLLFIIFVITTAPHDYLSFAAYAAVISIVVFLSKVPLSYVFKRVLVIIPFVLLVAIFLPFANKGPEGWTIFWNVMIKSFLAVLATIMLSSTTKFHKLLKGFELLKFPKIMIMMLAFMYRYVFILVDEAHRMERARDSRYFGGEYLRQIKIVCNIIGLLFIRAYERGERVYQSMSARGFDGNIITMNELKYVKSDMIFYIIFTGMILTIKIWSLF